MADNKTDNAVHQAGSDNKVGQVSDNTHHTAATTEAVDGLNAKTATKPPEPNAVVATTDGKSRVDAVPPAGSTVGEYMASSPDYKPLGVARAADAGANGGPTDGNGKGKTPTDGHALASASPEGKGTPLSAGPGDQPIQAKSPESTYRPSEGPTKADAAANPTETRKPGDQAKETSDKPQHVTKDQAIQGYADVLTRTGMSPEAAKQQAEHTYQRLSDVSKGQDGTDNDTRMKGGPEDQMRRASDAMKSVLDFKGDKLSDGQPNYMSMEARENMVKDMAARLEDPNKNVNQGHHNTCALESMQKQQLQGGDPAKVLENVASVANNGYATVTDKDGKNPMTVHVDSRSLFPDGESQQPYNSALHGDGGQRGQAGQVFDALAGQVNADLTAKRNGLATSENGIDKAGLVYMAAHADTMGAKNGQSDTNEGLFQRDGKGGSTMLDNSPNVGPWDAALVNRTIGGQDGAVFANKNFDGVGDGNHPPAGFPPDLKITTFSNASEAHDKVAAYEAKTGQSGQLLVNAAFLPGGGQKGHSGHAMNFTAGENGSFNLDNNWGTKYDLGSVSAGAFEKATDKKNWGESAQTPGQAPSGGDRVVPSGGDRVVPGGTPGPGHDTWQSGGAPLKPGDGRMPNETEADFKARMDFDKLKNNPNTDAKALQNYAKALSEWQAQEAAARAMGKPWNTPRPDFSQFNSSGN